VPKLLTIDPAVTRRKGRVEFQDIPVHAYDEDIAAERGRLGDAALLRMLRDMLVIREFETMLGAFKAQGAYADVKYGYAGPAHLSIGQEGVAVGSAFALAPDDHIFGSHRSHGEFLAKGLSASWRAIRMARCFGRLRGA
jgi:2-oxoisovalerate dehydrogenase E1 component